MKTIAVCVLLIACIAGASLRGFNAQRQGKKILNFQDVFVQVKSMLATEGPYSDVYQLLDDIKSQLQAEQAAQLTVYLDQKADCESELNLRTGEMNEATTAKAASVRQFNACSAAQGEAAIALEALGQTLGNKRSQLNAENALRANQAALYVSIMADYSRQLDNINLAIDFVNSLSDSVSTESMSPMLLLPQLTSKLAISSISTNSFEALAPIFISMTALIQADGTQDYGVVGAEGDAVGELVRLLTQLRDETEQTMQSTQLEERQRIEAYDANVLTLNGLIDQLTDEQNEISAHEQEMAQCITQETGIQEAADAKLSRNSGIFDATQTMCNVFEREYQDAEAARQQELVLLDALSELVREELSGGIRTSRADEEQGAWEDHDPESGYEYEADSYEA